MKRDFPALIHVWIGLLELFISTSGKAFWRNSGINEWRKFISTQEMLQENHSLMFWQFEKLHISTSAQKLSSYIFQYPITIHKIFLHILRCNCGQNLCKIIWLMDFRGFLWNGKEFQHWLTTNKTLGNDFILCTKLRFVQIRTFFKLLKHW